MNEMLKIQNLGCGYNGKIVLQDISFSIKRGEILAIIGQNGCGKSTLLKTIARAITDNTGDISYDNIDLNKKNTWELKQLGISSFVQGGMVFPTMRVSEHFEIILRNKNKVESATIKEEYLSYFPALTELMDKRAGNLSGGQRQMVSFAMLLAQQTQCWLLDEPTAGLSPGAVNEAIEFLLRMKLNEHKTMILVEHNYHVAFELADSVAIIKDGRFYDKFLKTEFQNENFLNTHLYN